MGIKDDITETFEFENTSHDSFNTFVSKLVRDLSEEVNKNRLTGEKMKFVLIALRPTEFGKPHEIGSSSVSLGGDDTLRLLKVLVKGMEAPDSSA